MSHRDAVAYDTGTVSKEDKYFYYNTLTGLVKALQGKYTTIDLRNEACVTGKIVKVDGRMNLELEDVIFYDSRACEHVFPSFFLKHRNIRYVHIPKGLSCNELLETQLAQLAPTKHVRARTFKTVRAERYNKETVMSNFASTSTDLQT